METVAERLTTLGITLPPASTPVANYVMTKRSGNLLFVSGHVSRRDGAIAEGRLGESMQREAAYELARATAIDILATAGSALTSLDAIASVVRVTGYVNSAPSFTEQPYVLNGASDLFVEVFGEDRGKHARAAVGVAQLPGGAAVEVDAIFELQ